MHIARRWRIKINPTTDIDIAFHDTIASTIPELYLPWLTHLLQLLSQVGTINVVAVDHVNFKCCLVSMALVKWPNIERDHRKQIPLCYLDTWHPELSWHLISALDTIPLCCLSFNTLRYQITLTTTSLHWKSSNIYFSICYISWDWICWCIISDFGSWKHKSPRAIWGGPWEHQSTYSPFGFPPPYFSLQILAGKHRI